MEKPEKRKQPEKERAPKSRPKKERAKKGEKKETAAVTETRKQTRKKQAQGLRRRWMLNSLAVVLSVLLLAGVAFVTTMYSSYYQVISEGMETQASTAASFLQNYSNEREYLSAARYYMNSDFTKSNMELQFLDSLGPGAHVVPAGRAPGHAGYAGHPEGAEQRGQPQRPGGDVDRSRRLYQRAHHGRLRGGDEKRYGGRRHPAGDLPPGGGPADAVYHGADGAGVPVCAGGGVVHQLLLHPLHSGAGVPGDGDCQAHRRGQLRHPDGKAVQ